MLENISWETYLAWMATAVAIYYLFVITSYYRAEVRALLNGTAKGGMPAASRHVDDAHPEVLGSAELYEQVEAFSIRVRVVIAEAFAGQVNASLMFSLLKPVFSEFNFLGQSTFRPALDELVLSECAKHGALVLSEDDVARLWDAVA